MVSQRALSIRPDPQPTHHGPSRSTTEDLSAVQELALIEDFEGHVAWVAGTSSESAFAVSILENPMRLVVDVAHP